MQAGRQCKLNMQSPQSCVCHINVHGLAGQRRSTNLTHADSALQELLHKAVSARHGTGCDTLGCCTACPHLGVDELQVDGLGPSLHAVKCKAQQVGQHTHAVGAPAEEEGQVKHTAAGVQTQQGRGTVADAGSGVLVLLLRLLASNQLLVWAKAGKTQCSDTGAHLNWKRS